jgi:hypothetical protein
MGVPTVDTAESSDVMLVRKLVGSRRYSSVPRLMMGDPRLVKSAQPFDKCIVWEKSPRQFNPRRERNSRLWSGRQTRPTVLEWIFNRSYFPSATGPRKGQKLEHAMHTGMEGHAHPYSPEIGQGTIRGLHWPSESGRESVKVHKTSRIRPHNVVAFASSFQPVAVGDSVQFDQTQNSSASLERLTVHVLTI